MIKVNTLEERKYIIEKEASPQTQEELEIAKANLENELREKKLSGVPSMDKAWINNYTKDQIEIATPMMSMFDYMYSKNVNNMSVNAMDYMGKKITYEEMFYHIEDTAKRFKKFGVKEDDYVNLALPVSPETVYMIYGLDYIGAAAALIDPRVNAERMQYYLNLVSSNLVGITGIYAGTMRSILDSQNGVQMINISPLQSFDANEKNILKGLYNTKMFLEHLKEISYNIFNNKRNKIISSRKFYKTDVSDIILDSPIYHANKVSLGEYTSGTTGVPKGLGLEASAMNLLTEQLMSMLNAKAGDTILSIMPPFISYGVACGTHTAFCSGVESIMIPKFSPEIFPELIIKHKPNIIVGVPMFLQLLMESTLITDDFDLSFIKIIIVGGNKTEAEFEVKFNEWLRKHNCSTIITKGGGMAEYSSCLFYTPTLKTCTPGIYGIPLPKVDVKIADENDQELGYYEIGEIHVSSDQAMNGYINNKSATDEFFYYDENGIKWGRTGDLGYIDTDGQVTLLNRKKQMIIRPDGHNVFPSEIAEVIKGHYAVKNCLVVGIKDSELISGEWPTAYIELKQEYLDNADKMLYEIMQLCVQKLPLRDRPRDCDYYQVKKIINTVEGKTNENATIENSNVVKRILK